MTNFTSAFKQGQKSAECASAFRKEIDEVFKALTNELSEATEGKLVISLETSFRPFAEFARVAVAASAMLTGEAPRSPRRETWICAGNPYSDVKTPVQLAKFDRPYEGYPCTITYGKSDVRCNDRTSLELGLSEMLTDAWIADQLRQVISLPPAPKEEQA